MVEAGEAEEAEEAEGRPTFAVFCLYLELVVVAMIQTFDCLENLRAEYLKR